MGSRTVVASYLCALVASASLLATIAPPPANAQERAQLSGRSCPDVSKIVRIRDPRGAIPTVKRVYGSPTRALEARRGPRSPYADVARRECGAAVVRKSVYVVVHPIGERCSACDLHAFVVRYRNGRWRVWTGY